MLAWRTENLGAARADKQRRELLRQSRVACPKHLLRSAALAKSTDLGEHAVDGGVLTIQPPALGDESARSEKRRCTTGQERGESGSFRRSGQRRGAHKVDEVERREALPRGVMKREADEE